MGSETPKPGQAEPATTVLIGDADPRGREIVLIGDRFMTTVPLPEQGVLRIGRSEDNDVRIDDPSVSRAHAVLHVSADTVRIEDLGSANGSVLAGRSLEPRSPTTVTSADVGQLGAVTFVLQRGNRDKAIRARTKSAAGSRDLVIESARMREIHELVARVADSDLPVLLLGETGVGKEMVAERLHEASPRASRPLLRINCAALSETLLESELFGHEKGAFTGAGESKPGLIESASGGTLLLDEIGELPSQTQAKLLRALEESTVLPVGARTPRPIDVRFVAATNRDLAADVEAGRFRSDLYYRLDGISIAIPPLRERREEIGALARRFVADSSEQFRRPEPTLTQAALDLLLAHDWPGNVRELRNLMRRATLLCAGSHIDVEHLKFDRRSAPTVVEHAEETPVPGSLDAVAAGGTEKNRILDALEQCAGNQTRAARLLGISRRTLVHKLDVYGIPRPRKGRTR